jgi:ankyrin repeat protein
LLINHQTLLIAVVGAMFLSPVIARRIMEVEALRQLAREEDKHKETPVHLAVIRDQVDVLRVLLNHDPSLGYIPCSDGTPLLNIAALRGHVSAAREILNHCPDTPYATESGWTCLHEAVESGQPDFVNFVLASQQLRKLVNMRDVNGQTALHLSVNKCMPEILKALLRHHDLDVTVLTNKGSSATWSFDDAIKSAKSLQWVRYLSSL